MKNIQFKKRLERQCIINQCVTSFNDYLIGFTFILLYNIAGLAYLLAYQTLLNCALLNIRARLASHFNSFETGFVLKMSLMTELFITLCWLVTMGITIVNVNLIYLNLITSAISVLGKSVVEVKEERIGYALFSNAKDRTGFQCEKAKSVSLFMVIGCVLNVALMTYAESHDKLLVYKFIVLLHLIFTCYDFYASVVEYRCCVDYFEDESS